MPFWKFLSACVSDLWDRSWKTREKVERIGTIIGAVAWAVLSISIETYLRRIEEVKMFPIVSTIALILAICFLILISAHRRYKKEYDERERSEKELHGDSEEMRVATQDEWSKLSDLEKAMISRLVSVGTQNLNQLADHIQSKGMWFDEDKTRRIDNCICPFVYEENPTMHSRSRVFGIKDTFKPYLRSLISKLAATNLQRD